MHGGGKLWTLALSRGSWTPDSSRAGTWEPGSLANYYVPYRLCWSPPGCLLIGGGRLWDLALSRGSWTPDRSRAEAKPTSKSSFSSGPPSSSPVCFWFCCELYPLLWYHGCWKNNWLFLFNFLNRYVCTWSVDGISLRGDFDHLGHELLVSYNLPKNQRKYFKDFCTSL